MNFRLSKYTTAAYEKKAGMKLPFKSSLAQRFKKGPSAVIGAWNPIIEFCKTPSLKMSTVKQQLLLILKKQASLIFLTCHAYPHIKNQMGSLL